MLGNGNFALNIPGPKLRRPGRFGRRGGITELGLGAVDPEGTGADLVKDLGKTAIASTILGLTIWGLFLRR